jgi:hypothetical protein
MKPATYVRVLRLRSSGCGKPSRAITEGGVERVPIRNGDWIEGRLVRPIKVRRPFEVRCVFFNGELCEKTYLSTDVVTVMSDVVRTQYVVYKFMRVPRFDSVRSLRAWD